MKWISVNEQSPPKDGTPFLCYDPSQLQGSFSEASIYVVKWEDPCGLREGGYRETGGECYFLWNPTHWMPLPCAPSIEKEE